MLYAVWDLKWVRRFSISEDRKASNVTVKEGGSTAKVCQDSLEGLSADGIGGLGTVDEDRLHVYILPDAFCLDLSQGKDYVSGTPTRTVPTFCLGVVFFTDVADRSVQDDKWHDHPRNRNKLYTYTLTTVASIVSFTTITFAEQNGCNSPEIVLTSLLPNASPSVVEVSNATGLLLCKFKLGSHYLSGTASLPAFS